MSTQKNYSPSSLKSISLKGVVRNFFLLRKESFSAATTLGVIAYPNQFDDYIRQCLAINWPGMSQFCSFWVATNWKRVMALPQFQAATQKESYAEFMAMVAEWRIKLTLTTDNPLVISLRTRYAIYIGKEWVYSATMPECLYAIKKWAHPSLIFSDLAMISMPPMDTGYSFTMFRGCPLITGYRVRNFCLESSVYLFMDNVWKKLDLPLTIYNCRVRGSVNDEYLVLLSYQGPEYNMWMVWIYDFNASRFVRLNALLQTENPISGLQFPF